MILSKWLSEAGRYGVSRKKAGRVSWLLRWPKQMNIKLIVVLLESNFV